MGDLLAVKCESCGEPMIPNVSTLDEEGCGWICLTPDCPEFSAGELEAVDLEEAGVPPGVARRIAKLVDHCLEPDSLESDEPANGTTALDEMRTNLSDARHLATNASRIARHLNDTVVAASGDCSEHGQQAKTDLAIASVLCLLAARSAHEAQIAIAGIDSGLCGFTRTSEDCPPTR